MKSFGTLLRTYIQRSGYTNYGIAQKARVNRTTLQKILSGERTPSPEFMDRIFPLLKLTPQEAQELTSLFEIIQTGESLFSQRQYIKKLLETLPDITNKVMSCQTNPLPVQLPAEAGLESSPVKLDFCRGRYEVEYLFEELLLKECQGSTPVMKINAPANIDFFKELFTRTIRRCQNSGQLNVQHLTCFLKSDVELSRSLCNLNSLANILPFLAASNFRYDVRYYYGNQIVDDAERTAFTYYVLFSDTVVLLSADYSTALPLNVPDLYRHFNNLFDAALNRAEPLVTHCPAPEDFLPHLIHLDMEQTPFLSLEYQPCIGTYLTEKMVQTYIRPEIENISTVLKMVNSRISQLKELESHDSIFSKAGLWDFVHTGFISDFPREYMIPLSIRDRLAALEYLYEDIYNDRRNHRMVNPLIFPISKELSCLLHLDLALNFICYNPFSRNFCYIQIEERTFLEAFADFFQYMVHSPLVYSKEDTLSAVRACINHLRQGLLPPPPTSIFE